MTAKVWSIASRKEWVVIESGPDIAALLGEEIEGFGTYAGGFWVTIGLGPVQFQAEAAHARECVHQLMTFLCPDAT